MAVCSSFTYLREEHDPRKMRKRDMHEETHCHNSQIPKSDLQTADALSNSGDLRLISQERLDAILADLTAQEGVRGVVVTTMEGLPLSSDLPPETTEAVAAILTSLVGKALDAVRELKEGSLSFLTLDTTEGQINIAPDVKEGLILVVLK